MKGNQLVYSGVFVFDITDFTRNNDVTFSTQLINKYLCMTYKSI